MTRNLDLWVFLGKPKPSKCRRYLKIKIILYGCQKKFSTTGAIFYLKKNFPTNFPMVVKLVRNFNHFSGWSEIPVSKFPMTQFGWKLVRNNVYNKILVDEVKRRMCLNGLQFPELLVHRYPQHTKQTLLAKQIYLLFWIY